MLDLFSGIGGFALAASWVWGDDLEIVGFCEIDPFCHKILKKHWPEVVVYDDIKELTRERIIANALCKRDKRESKDGQEAEGTLSNGATGFKESWTFQIGNGYPRPDTLGSPKSNNKFTVDLLTGGFPCQPYSHAGKRRGAEDDRALWPQMFRVISEVRPRWIIAENVGGFVNMGLDDCISDLEGEGYKVQAFIIPACAVNAPHRRERVWIVANCTESGLSQSGLAGIGQLQKEAGSGVHHRPEQSDSHASDTNNQRLQGHGEHGECTGQCSFRARAWEEPWLEAATRLCSVDDGLPGRLARPKGWRVNALKAAGNAIVPQVVAVIMQAIKDIEEGT